MPHKHKIILITLIGWRLHNFFSFLFIFQLKKVASEEHSTTVDAKANTESGTEITKDSDEPMEANPMENVNQSFDEIPALTPVVSIDEPTPPGVISPTSPKMAESLAPMESENSEKGNATDTVKEDHHITRCVDDKVEKVAEITQELRDKKEDEGQSDSKRLKLQATDNRDATEKLDEPIDITVEASQSTETDLDPEKVVKPPVKTGRGRGKGRARGRGRSSRGRKKRGS